MQRLGKYLLLANLFAVTSCAGDPAAQHASLAKRGGYSCSYEGGSSFVQLEPCPEVAETARSVKRGDGTGYSIADYHKLLPVRQEALDHEALCAALSRPSAEIGVSWDEKTRMLSEAGCE